jgi:hypothetical protein
VVFSLVIGGHGDRLITMNNDYVAVAQTNPNQVVVYGALNGKTLNQYPVDLTASDMNGDPPGHVVPITVGPSAIYWFTGSSTVALSPTNLQPMWTVPSTLGPGVVFAGNYLAPERNTLLVLNQATGTRIGAINDDRHGYTGDVFMATLGPVVLEQRGATLAALH